MRIQELESKTGLERATIRFYEREGLIIPTRSENGYREYSQEDASQLLKIKLLRQLGMSLEKIRSLKQGSEDFSKAMHDQIAYLSERIEEQKRARIVCQRICTDGVNYSTMDPEYYLKLLREIPSESPGIFKKSFHENVPEEIHPWRRYFARTMDYALFSAILQCIIFVGFRMRPIPNKLLDTFMGIGYYCLFVPVEALMLHLWGTTPGKWVMGIRLERIEGGNLDYQDALDRSWQVLKYGMGFGIPCIQLIANVYSYCKLTGTSWRRWRRYDDPVDPPEDMDWDTETEIIYSSPEGKGWLRFVSVAMVYLILFGITVCDIPKPTNRSNNLTIAQFAENYNETMRLMDRDGTLDDELQPDGSRTPVPYNTVVVYMGGTAIGPERPEFQYETEGEYLRQISYSRAMADVFFYHPLDGMCQNAAITALLSQPDCSLWDLKEFLELWEREKMNSDVSFTYKNIGIQWQIQTENVVISDQTYIRKDSELDSRVDIQFCMTIHDT